MTPIPSTPVAARSGGWVRRRGAAAVAAGLVVALSTLGLAPSAALASSHREAPLTAADPSIDATDFYAFVSPDHPDTVTFIADYIPFQEPNGGPNFYPFATDASYIVNVDSDGDARPDIKFRWTFRNIDKRGNDTFLYNDGVVNSIDDKHLLFRQVYTLEEWTGRSNRWSRLVKDAPVAPSRVGQASMPNYQKLRDQASISLSAGVKAFAGQADDPFFADLRVFDLLYGGNLSEVGQDTLAGYNVNSMALQVPRSALALNGDAARNPVIGAWATAERDRVQINGFNGSNSEPRSSGQINKFGGPGKDARNRYDNNSVFAGHNSVRVDSDGYRSDRNDDNNQVQVSRLGNPLVNEVVVPAGLKDEFNSLSPDKDGRIKDLVDRVLYPEIPKLVQGIYKIQAPPGPRNDLAEIFLTGITTRAGGPIQKDLNSQLNNTDARADRFVASEELRLNMSVAPVGSPNRLGVLGGDVQGFPNGRRLSDDVIDISLQAMEGAAASGKLVDALAKGDKVDANDHGFSGHFPFLALPNGQGVNTHGTVSASKAGFFGGYGTGGPMTVGGLAAVVAFAGFLFSWYRRRHQAVLAKATTGTGVNQMDAGAVIPGDTVTTTDLPGYSGRRRSPDADDPPTLRAPGDAKPDGDGYTVI